MSVEVFACHRCGGTVRGSPSGVTCGMHQAWCLELETETVSALSHDVEALRRRLDLLEERTVYR